MEPSQDATETTAIEKSINVAERTLDRINETIRDQEGRARLKDISQYLWIGQGSVFPVSSPMVYSSKTVYACSRLDLTAPTRNMGPRKLLKEGILFKSKSGRRLRGFLCSDILVLTDEAGKRLYRMVGQLYDCLHN
jgi:actin cytoskeleton-regulatory complex protein PAN1